MLYENNSNLNESYIDNEIDEFIKVEREVQEYFALIQQPDKSPILAEKEEEQIPEEELAKEAAECYVLKLTKNYEMESDDRKRS